MPIAQILARKGDSVITARTGHTLHEVVQLMSEKGIGAVVVCSSSGELVGILSERDIMRAIAREGARVLEDRVSTHMTKDVVTCTHQDSIQSLMERMTQGRFRHMPVLEDGQLIGMISIGDLIKNRLSEIESEREALREYISTA